ncbi:MAG TPA: LysM domain-containing protein [Kofleriaceae bacterium]|nr:LysM domain-containing protein [Kofleriaceae bacterium]
MKPTNVVALLALSSASLLAVPQLALADHPYVVVAGDDCISVATKQLGSRAAIPALHKANPQLGPMPHKLKPGQVLTIPDENHAPDAKLSSARGAVKVREPAKPTWNNGQRGMDLFRAWRVNTQTQASAEITFRNNSQIEMREDTVVIIYGADATKTRVDSVEVALESGALRSRLGELAGKPSSTTVTTPSSGITGLASDFLIAVDRAGMSTIANHGKTAIAVRSVDKKKKPSGKPVSVGSNMGTRVEVGKAPEKPRPLPAMPQWNASETAVLGAPTATLRGRWAPIANVAKFRVEIADSNASNQVTVLEIPGSASAFESQNVPAGVYTIRVAAIDADGLEGKASAPLLQTVDVVAAPWQLNGEQRSIALASTISAPAGKTCQLDGATPANQIVVTTAGTHKLQCGAASLAFDTKPVTAEIKAAALVVGQPGNIHVVVHGEPHGALTLRSDAAITIAKQSQDGASITAEVTATSHGVLKVYAGDVVVAELAVTAQPAPALAPPPPPSPQASAPARRFELGFGIGGQGLLRGHDKLAPNDTANQTLASGVALHGNFAVRLPYRLGLELDASVANVATRPLANDAQLLSAGVQLAVRPVVTKRFELRALGGAGVRTSLDNNDADAYLSVGAAALTHLTQDSGVRIDARDMLVRDATSGFAHRGQLMLTLYTRFGK